MLKVPKEHLKPSHTVTDETDVSKLPETHKEIKGYDFNKGLDYDKLIESFATMGIQSSQLSKAIEITKEMLLWRGPENEKCTIFLGFTSGGVSSGVRELIRFLVQHKLVDVLVTTAGAVEEDLMKCSQSHFLSNFRENDDLLRDKGVIRMGNIITTQSKYKNFYARMEGVLDKMLKQQEEDNVNWTPSSAIDLWGKEVGDETSIAYWCHHNKIPMFCPGFTDGAIGELFLNHHESNEKKLRIDVVQDIRGVNDAALNAKCTGVLILGGGVIKHHILNANLMRNGADYAVFINTGQEFDGSDAGAKPTEALSWGKLRLTSKRVKVYSEFSLVFPFLVAKAFYPEYQKRNNLDKKAS
jgi:deoxyhypusine synthase